jgi:hypothetical protein
MAVLRIGVVISAQEGPLFTSTETKKYIYTYVWSKFIYCGTYFEFCYKSSKNIRLLISMPATKKLRELMLTAGVFLINLK